MPIVAVGVGTGATFGATAPGIVDVVVRTEDDAWTRVVDAVTRHPRAATALALLLRGGAERSIAEGPVPEYSMLHAVPEFAAGRSGRAAKPAVERHFDCACRPNRRLPHIALAGP